MNDKTPERPWPTNQTPCRYSPMLKEEESLALPLLIDVGLSLGRRKQYFMETGISVRTERGQASQTGPMERRRRRRRGPYLVLSSPPPTTSGRTRARARWFPPLPQVPPCMQIRRRPSLSLSLSLPRTSDAIVRTRRKCDLHEIGLAGGGGASQPQSHFLC